jgi:flagellar biosynthesis chaperone FliJ
MSDYLTKEIGGCVGEDRPSRPLEDVANTLSQLYGRADSMCHKLKDILKHLLGEKELQEHEVTPQMTSGVATLGDGDIARIQTGLVELSVVVGNLEAQIADLKVVV